MSETWADEEGAIAFFKKLRKKRESQVELLVGLAKSSHDPSVRECWAAIAQIDQIMRDMEEERGNPND